MCKHKNKELLPYYEKAKELLHYDSESGMFIWRLGRSRAKKGYIAGATHGSRYERIAIKLGDGSQKKIPSHRLAWFITYGYLPNIIDHIDGDGLNNRINNLRECTNSQNQMNTGKPSSNTSGVKGVSWRSRDNVWQVRIGFSGKYIWLGSFKRIEDAEQAYKDKAKQLFGEFYRD